MSNKAMSWAIDATVTKSHKLVLMLIADAHNGHTGACFPSQTFLEEKSGLADSTILEVLKDLEDWGFLTRHTQSLGRGKGSRRDFELHFEVLTPGNLDLLKSGLGPPEKTPLDPRPTRPPYKEEPEIEPEITGTARDVFDHYNRTAKEAGWVVHSKLTEAIKSTLSARIKEHSAESVKAFITALRKLEWTSKGFAGNPDFRASLVYICRPRTFAEHFDKLVSQAPKPDLLAAVPELHEGLKRERWESGIAWYVESGGGWDLDAWSPPPHKPGCKAPADLLAKAKPVADWILESTGGRV